LRARRAAAADLRPRPPPAWRRRRPGAAVNQSIGRLFLLVLGLFGVLVFASQRMPHNSFHRRALLSEQLIKRGTIRSADGKVLARSPTLPGKRFGRRYPTGALFAHAVGCTSLDRGRSGIEDFYNDPLTGRATNAI